MEAETNSRAKKRRKTLNEKVKTMDGSLDHDEQYSRRNYFLIHRLKENEKEDTDEIVIEVFKKEMQEKVSVSDINRSYRLGKNIPEVDLGLLSSNLQGTMSAMQLLEKRKS